VVLAVVEAKYLFIDVTKHMEWFDSNVGATQTTFQEAPEVFQSVCVDAAIDVGFGMVHEVMHEAVMQLVVQGILDRDLRQIRATVVPNIKRETLQAEVLNNVKYGSTVYTDNAVGYEP
jgi:hypothetical protein